MRISCGDLSRWLEQQIAIVTPTPLLANVARQQFAREQLAGGAESWKRPSITSIEAWLASCWNEARYAAADIPTLLSPAQEHVLWRQVIKQDGSEVFDLDAAADLCRGAARLMAEWRIPADAAGWGEREGAQQFQRWRKLFSTRCANGKWITRAELWRLVPEWIRNGSCKADRAVLVGFERCTPGLKQLPLTTGGSEVPREPRPAGRDVITECTSFEEEIEHAARWVRSQFEQDHRRSLAVFVPGLVRQHALVHRVFSRIIDAAVFSTNGGAPLAKHPVGASALLVLELARERIPLHAASALLRSPFLSGAQTERNERALADLRLRKRKQAEIDLRDLERASEKCPKLQRAWKRLRRVLRERPVHAGLSRWSEFFGRLLRAVRWPGDAELTAQEQQAMDAWQDALSDLASLGIVSPPVTLDETLAHLRRLLARGVDEANLFAPVQILDSTDAAGLAFDAAFLAGMSDENWPPRLTPNPLVPLAIQRAHGVPESSAESAQLEKQRLSDALLSSAPVIEVSYSGTPWSDGGAGLPSRPAVRPTILEMIDDTNGPPLTLTENVRGGTSLIKSQSQCPFRAFAEIRLRAGTMEEASLGLDSRDRGTLLHKALQAVWQNLQSSERLSAASDQELRLLVQEALAAAVDGHEQPIERLARETERARLEEVILEWLAVEREREQPFTVEMVELDREHEFSGLRLKLRIDRIDRLRNDKLLLIDYKSGKQDAPKWKEDRPQEPQLLVYSSALGSEVDGLFLCQLKPRDMKPIGCSREKQFSAKSAAVEDCWNEFLASASDCVEKLAREFMAGYAALDPAKHACDYCKLKPLCRIQEQCGIREDDADD